MEKIVVLYGGRSSEHEVSVLSASNIVSALAGVPGYETLPVYISKAGEWSLREPGNLGEGGSPVVLSPDSSHRGLIFLGDKERVIHIDAVFPALHGKNGEDGSVQGLCRLAGVPCVGPSVLASALCMDKDFTRRIVSKLKGVVFTPYLAFGGDDLSDMESAAAKAETEIGYPCFIKPANAGSSCGVTKASDRAGLVRALRLALSHDRKVLVEKEVRGRELETAVLGNGEILVSGVGEIIAAADFYDYDAKYHNAESMCVIPAPVPQRVSDEIRSQAAEIYRATDCAGMARVDFFLEDGTGNVIFNEINTIPGFTPISMYSKLFEAMGIMAPELVVRLIKLAQESL